MIAINPKGKFEQHNLAVSFSAIAGPSELSEA
jgi:hypothetical protein